ncbi:MAG TPA: hypothetical protein VGI19_11875 [Candidatus Cybelea sp.]|jgi:hypothetical protein
MKSTGVFRHAGGLVALAVASLGGCSGLPASPGAQTAVSAKDGALRRDQIKSWMAADAKTKDLLYLTIGTVNVYSYPQGVLEGQLTGFSDPLGDCTDKAGDVYIADYTKDAVVEYAHGGTQPLRTLSVPGTGPVNCAVDPTSGDLVVTTSGNASGGGANVAVYHKAKGTPVTYTDSEIEGFTYCAYDHAGDLFVDGTPAPGYGYDFELAELSKGAKALAPVTLQGGVSWDGALQWDGRYLAVGQPIRPAIQRYAIRARHGKLLGTTPLTSAYDAGQFIIIGNKAVVVNEYFYDIYFYRWDLLLFNYPAGGYDTSVIENSGSQTTSVALSKRRK